MALVEVLLPAMGEGIIEATLIAWTKKEGETVSIDENLIEVATDKVNSEVPSTVSGTLSKCLYQENDVIPVGKPFAIISTSESDQVSSQPAPQVNLEQEAIIPDLPEKIAEPVVAPVTQITESSTHTQSSDRFYSPLVMNMAKEENISMRELDMIVGSGQGGRVTKEDMLQYLSQGRHSAVQQANINPPAPIAEVQKKAITSEPVKTESAKVETSVNFGPEVEVVKMDRMRKLIADHMVKSVQTSPHVCSFIEADVTAMVQWRNKVKNKFKELYGENLTYTPILIEAIAKALREFPMINSSLDGDNIIVKKEVHIGMAAALPDGNLIVPVIKNADMLNLMGLAKKVNDLGARSKKNQLKPDEISGGTYTMTNLGSFGNLFGTPIINQPQVAIMGVGAIVKKPVVIETPDGDTIGIRHMMYLSHSYDHRVVDGMLGGTFVKRVADILESFDPERAI